MPEVSAAIRKILDENPGVLTRGQARRLIPLAEEGIRHGSPECETLLRIWQRHIA